MNGGMKRMNTKKSDKIIQAYLQQKPKLQRREQTFSATWQTTVDKLFPLLCPAREADWIPGWDCSIIYSSTGYAEDKCIFTTDESNSVGDGVWIFTGFEQNKHVEFVRFRKDVLLHAKITLKDNGNGTITGTWETTSTALTDEGNRELSKMPVENKMSGALKEMIDHYLKKGKMIGKFPLVTKMMHHIH